MAHYRVRTIAELEAGIADATVAEPPGWEDLITAENLEARLEEINGYLSNR